MLVVKFSDASDLAPNKEKYQAFMKEFTKEKWDETAEYSKKNYPGIRVITGEYQMREIELVK